jgi:hypothetical protein
VALKVISFAILVIFMPGIVIAKIMYKNFCSQHIKLKIIQDKPLHPQPLNGALPPQPIPNAILKEPLKIPLVPEPDHPPIKVEIPLPKPIKQPQPINVPNIVAKEEVKEWELHDSEHTIEPEPLSDHFLRNSYSKYYDCSHLAVCFLALNQPPTPANLKEMIDQNGKPRIKIEEAFETHKKRIKQLPSYESERNVKNMTPNLITHILQELEKGKMDGVIITPGSSSSYAFRKLNNKIEFFTAKGLPIYEEPDALFDGVCRPYVLSYDATLEQSKIVDHIYRHMLEEFAFGKPYSFTVYPIKLRKP